MTQSLVSSIGQIAITVERLPRAVLFYRDTLGLPLLFETPSLAFFACAGVRLMLSVTDKPGSTYGSIIYYRTDDIDQTFQVLQARSVKFEAPPRLIARLPDQDLWMAFFRDSEGNLAALMSERRMDRQTVPD